MDDPDDIPPLALAEIRRAAFELRQSDPQAAVRVLRRAVQAGGPAAALAHGALAEIYLEEFGDLDGAEAEFRAVLQAAPGLPAAELGLARVLREAGRLDEAEAQLVRALGGLSAGVAALREAHAKGEELREGAEAEALALLEVAVELAELKHARGRNGGVQVPLDESLCAFAAQAALFDAAPEDEEEGGADLADWERFHALWARLRVLTGRAAEGARALAEAEAAGRLPPLAAARLRSQALEEAGEPGRALEQARRLLALEEAVGRAALEDDVLHAAGLCQALGDEPAARAVLQAALGRAEALLAGAALDEEERERLGAAVKGYREALGPGALLGLGRRS